MEVDVIHMFIQMSRALGQPCKIYKMLSVAAPVIYISPKPSHVTEILDGPNGECLSIRVNHGEADLWQKIQHLRQTVSGNRR